MKLIRTIIAEMVGLFVDDWAFAVLTLLWIALFAGPLRTLGAAAGPTLFAGLAGLTLLFVVRKVRR